MEYFITLKKLSQKRTKNAASKLIFCQAGIFVLVRLTFSLTWLAKKWNNGLCRIWA